MILPIYSYGHPILRQKTDEIDANYPDLKALIDNMWETMYNANGVGLAAPQIGLAQHEYDHIEGKLFTDKLSPFKRKILKSKLTQIEKGNIKIDYPMEFAKTMKRNNNGKSR